MLRKLVFLTCFLWLCSFCNVQAQCAPGETAIDLYIHTELFSNEIYWQVVDSNGSVIVSTVPNTYPNNYTTYGPTFIPEHQFCLNDTVEYSFDAYDSFGDSWGGGTYEVKRSCDDQLLINNGGITPWIGYSCSWSPCPMQTSEQFIPGQCLNRDLRLDSLGVDSLVCAESSYYINLTIANIGIYAIDTAWLHGIVDGDTVDTTVYLSWAPGQTHTVPVGPFYSSGSASGITHGVTGWVEVASEGDTTNNLINTGSVTAFAQSNWLQTQTYSPGLTPTAGTIASAVPFCDTTFLTLDSCSRIKEVIIEPLSIVSTTPMQITLIAPWGGSVVLIDSSIGPLSNLSQIKFSDQAASPYTANSGPGTYKPASPGGFAQLNGNAPSGAWTLEMVQAGGGASLITLHNWSIEFDKAPLLTLGDSLSICGNNSFSYGIGALYSNYLWSTGDTTTVISIDQAGTYTVTVTDDFGCVQIDSMEVILEDTVLAGQLVNTFNQAVAGATVDIFTLDPQTSLAVPLASTQTDAQGFYSYSPIEEPQIYLRAVPDTVVYPYLFPTYYDGELLLSNAMPLAGNNQCDTIDGSFEMILSANPGGNGSISGNIYACDSSGPGSPVANQTIFLLDLLDQPISWTVTDAQGYFQFSSLPIDTFRLWADNPNINNQLAPDLGLDFFTPSLDSVVICQYSDLLDVVIQPTDTSDTAGSSGIGPLAGTHSIKLFPNPAHDRITVKWSQSSRHTITLINALGQAVIREAPASNAKAVDFQVGHLARGIYTLRLEGPTGNWQGKAVLR